MPLPPLLAGYGPRPGPHPWGSHESQLSPSSAPPGKGASPLFTHQASPLLCSPWRSAPAHCRPSSASSFRFVPPPPARKAEAAQRDPPLQPKRTPLPVSAAILLSGSQRGKGRADWLEGRRRHLGEREEREPRFSGAPPSWRPGSVSGAERKARGEGPLPMCREHSCAQQLLRRDGAARGGDSQASPLRSLSLRAYSRGIPRGRRPGEFRGGTKSERESPGRARDEVAPQARAEAASAMLAEGTNLARVDGSRRPC